MLGHVGEVDSDVVSVRRAVNGNALILVGGDTAVGLLSGVGGWPRNWAVAFYYLRHMR